MKSCIDCQFLVKRVFMGKGTQGGIALNYLQWDDEELDAKAITNEQGDKAACFRGVWNHSSDSSLDVKARVEENRKKCKFFMPLDRSRLVTSAKELWEIKRQNRLQGWMISAIVISATLGGIIGGLIGR